MPKRQDIAAVLSGTRAKATIQTMRLLSSLITPDAALARTWLRFFGWACSMLDAGFGNRQTRTCRVPAYVGTPIDETPGDNNCARRHSSLESSQRLDTTTSSFNVSMACFVLRDRGGELERSIALEVSMNADSAVRRHHKTAPICEGCICVVL